MTARRKRELTEKFLEWARKRGFSVRAERSDGNAVTFYEIVQNGEDGKPLNTLCCEVFDTDEPAEKCWLSILEKRCAGKLAVDQLYLAGLGKAKTLEELELRLEICDAG